jgi:RecA-superfamily ATPases implicated in signal transduction
MATREEADYLVASVMMLPDVRTSAIRSLGGAPLFDPLLFPVHAMIWDGVAKLAAVSENSGISPVSLACEIKSANTSPSQTETLDDALQLLQEMSTEVKPGDVSPIYAGRILESFVVEAKKAAFISKLADIDDLSGLSTFTESTVREVSQITYTGTPTIESPLEDPETYMPEQDPMPTGIDWIDFLSGGGHCEGETVGILGPTGGGKTLTATSMMIARCKRESHTLLVTCEQDVKGDVSTRLYTRLLDDMNGDLLRDYKDPLHPELEGSRVDVTFFRKYPFRSWPKVVKDRYADLKAKYSRYLHVVDFSSEINLTDPKPQGMQGVKDIDLTLEALERQGKHVEFLLVDWLWPAVDRWFTYGNVTKRFSNRLEAAFQYIMELKQITKKRNTVTFLFHQLDTAHTRASAQTQPSCADAWNIKSFAMMLSHCYVIGNRDKESQVMWLGNDKARTNLPQYILGKMDGAMGVIEKTDGYELSRGRFVPKGTGDTPVESDSPDPSSRYM